MSLHTYTNFPILSISYIMFSVVPKNSSQLYTKHRSKQILKIEMHRNIFITTKRIYTLYKTYYLLYIGYNVYEYDTIRYTSHLCVFSNGHVPRSEKKTEPNLPAHSIIHHLHPNST